MQRKLSLAFVLLCGVLIFLGGCGQKKADTIASPHLQNVALTSYSEGTEDSQFVEAKLLFDQPVAVTGKAAGQLRVTIAGNRLKKKDYTLTQDQEQPAVAVLKMQVKAIENGKLTIGPADQQKGFTALTSIDGRYAVWPFEAECLIPSGLSFHTKQTVTATGSQKAAVVKEVAGLWEIRNITWVRLLLNGQVVESSPAVAGETMDGAVAVHGHDFMALDTDEIAAEIAETLKLYFSNEYQVTAKGTEITVEKRQCSPGDTLDLEIYTYQKIEPEGTAN